MSAVFNTDLWDDFIQGSQQAFNALYMQTAESLYSFGLKYTRDKDLIKDCIHDLFVDLYKYRSSLSAAENVKFYLFASLKRKIIAALKKEDVHADYETVNFSFLITSSTEDNIINGENSAELLARLEKELQRLPARQKEVLYLRFNSGLDYEEAAEIMNISAATCRTLVYRAVKELRLKMENTVICQLLFLLFGK